MNFADKPIRCRSGNWSSMFRIQSAAILLLCVGIPGILRAQESSSGIEATAAIEKALVDVIARAEKSVVASARVRVERAGETFGFETRPDPFGRRPIPASKPEPTDPDFIPNEYGAGVVVGRGLILTAYHVLGEESLYYVTTHERKVYQAWVKGADPRSDLAVLGIEAAELPPIRFGDAAGVKKGQIVVTLGNPHAIARDGQVSAGWGIVSNLARKVPPVPGEPASTGKPTLHHFGTLIQTDAKLNLGASGGPLLNLKGEMIGLSVALAATAGYETAAGYAIPVDATFRRVVETLKLGREVEYGFLGIQPGNLTQQEVLAGMHGIRVHRVLPGTPADRYGLREDDVVTAVNGRPIHESDALVLEVGRLPVEAVARLSLLRNNRRRTVNVTLAKYPVRGKKIVTAPPPSWRGMRIDYPTAFVDPDPLAQAGMTMFGEGVIVVDVEKHSPAWEAGLRRGMLITRVGRVNVRTPKEFRAAVARHFGPVQLHMADEETPLRTVTPGS